MLFVIFSVSGFPLSSSPIHTYSDSELLLLYKQEQHKEAFGILFHRYKHLVLGVCLKYLRNRDDAEDAVMQIFEKLLTDILKHDIQEFRFWLHTVAKNHCLMQLRKEQSLFKNQNQLNKDAASFMETEDDMHLNLKVLKEAQLENMHHALNQLSEPQRVCVELFYLHDKSYQEIADQTGYPMNEVRSYIQNGKRNLKIQMEKKRE